MHDENAAGMGGKKHLLPRMWVMCSSFLKGISGHAGLFGTAKDVATLGHLYLQSLKQPNNENKNSEYLLPRFLVEQFVKEQAVGQDGTRRGLGWMLKAISGNALIFSSCGSKFSDESFGHTGFDNCFLFCFH